MTAAPDEVRLLARQMLVRATELLSTSVSPQEAVIRVYNDGCSDFQDESESLHPATDLWILAHHVALGALHEPLVDPHLRAGEAIGYAIETLDMLLEAEKLEVG